MTFNLTSYVLLLTLSTAISAQTPIIGSCANITLPKASDDAEKFDTTLIVRVLRDKVRVTYPFPIRGFEPIHYLKFDTRVEPLREFGTLIQVREIGSEEPLGWVEKQDLLCQVEKPLWEKGLPRKALVKLSTDTDTHGAPVYASPDPQDCAEPCEPHLYITRFNNYFIFAEDPNTGRHLLAQRFNLIGAEFSPLVGWVDKNRLISWNTSITLRPKNDTWNEQEAKVIMGYQYPGDHEAVVGIVEGNIWYTYPMKMPLLGLESNHYHVAAPPNLRECNQPICSQVNEFYIPIKPNEMQEEILMPAFLIDKWLKVIKPLTTLDDSASATELRSQFKTTLFQEIQGVIREPPIEMDASQELKEILIEGKNGLPFSPQSSLLQYTFKDFDKLATCELTRLIDWLRSVEQILTGMQSNPTLKIKFTLKDYETPCSGLSEKGRKIKQLNLDNQTSKDGKTDKNQPDRDVRTLLGPNDNYSYCHGLRGIVLCSVPVEVLP